MDAGTSEIHYSRILNVEHSLGPFADFHEILAGGFSRRQFRDGELHQYARLDHVYTNSPIKGLKGNGCHAKYTIPITSRRMTSDDSPMQGPSRAGTPCHIGSCGVPSSQSSSPRTSMQH